MRVWAWAWAYVGRIALKTFFLYFFVCTCVDRAVLSESVCVCLGKKKEERRKKATFYYYYCWFFFIFIYFCLHVWIYSARHSEVLFLFLFFLSVMCLCVYVYCGMYGVRL